MPFKSQKPALLLKEAELEELKKISKSRNDGVARVERAKIIILFSEGQSISAIARELKINRDKVDRCITKALQFGVLTALNDLPRSGRKKLYTPEAETWIIDLSCQKPKDLGYSYELWTNRLLAEHIKKHCQEEGHPCLIKISRGTISKLLSRINIKPHKISYYLERRDPDFETKMAQILLVYKEVELLRESDEQTISENVILSYDEKPGIQAIENMAPDLLPKPGKNPTLARDHQYIRHGTVSLMAGINLLNGHVHGTVVDRHRSKEFIDFLRTLDEEYPKGIKIRIILDNHSAHISKETKRYLKEVPNRFEFIFTPKHGSWLNIIESFFGKMARTFLRGIRVSSKEELKERIYKFLEEINRTPVVFKWKYGLDSLAVT